MFRLHLICIFCLLCCFSSAFAGKPNTKLQLAPTSSMSTEIEENSLEHQEDHEMPEVQPIIDISDSEELDLDLGLSPSKGGNLQTVDEPEAKNSLQMDRQVQGDHQQGTGENSHLHRGKEIAVEPHKHTETNTKLALGLSSPMAIDDSAGNVDAPAIESSLRTIQQKYDQGVQLGLKVLPSPVVPSVSIHHDQEVQVPSVSLNEPEQQQQSLSPEAIELIESVQERQKRIFELEQQMHQKYQQYQQAHQKSIQEERKRQHFQRQSEQIRAGTSSEAIRPQAVRAQAIRLQAIRLQAIRAQKDQEQRAVQAESLTRALIKVHSETNPAEQGAKLQQIVELNEHLLKIQTPQYQQQLRTQSRLQQLRTQSQPQRQDAEPQNGIQQFVGQQLVQRFVQRNRSLQLLKPLKLLQFIQGAIQKALDHLSKHTNAHAQTVCRPKDSVTEFITQLAQQFSAEQLQQQTSNPVGQQSQQQSPMCGSTSQAVKGEWLQQIKQLNEHLQQLETQQEPMVQQLIGQQFVQEFLKEYNVVGKLQPTELVNFIKHIVQHHVNQLQNKQAQSQAECMRINKVTSFTAQLVQYFAAAEPQSQSNLLLPNAADQQSQKQAPIMDVSMSQAVPQQQAPKSDSPSQAVQDEAGPNQPVLTKEAISQILEEAVRCYMQIKLPSIFPPHPQTFQPHSQTFPPYQIKNLRGSKSRLNSFPNAEGAEPSNERQRKLREENGDEYVQLEKRRRHG